MAIGLSYFKTFLKIPASNSTQDANLQIYLDGAWTAFIDEIGRDIVQTTYPAASDVGRGDSGYYSGNGYRHILLRQTPVILNGLTVYLDYSGRFGQNPDGSFASATQLVYGTDFLLRTDGCLPGSSTVCSYSGILERIGTSWPARTVYMAGSPVVQLADGQGNVKVAYTAGFPDIPNDIKFAICKIAAYIRRTADKGGPVQSESLGGYSYSLGQQAAAGAFPEIGDIRAVVNKYKRVRV